jgi:hypothetical protein
VKSVRSVEIEYGSGENFQSDCGVIGRVVVLRKEIVLGRRREEVTPWTLPNTSNVKLWWGIAK